MYAQEIYVAEQTMHARVRENLNQNKKRNQWRRLRQTRPGLVYHLGRLLIRWGEQLKRYGRTRRPLTLEGPTGGVL